MKYTFYSILAITILLWACNGDKSTRGSTADTGRLAKATSKPTALATPNNSAIQSMSINNEIEITANDRMQYSDTLFKVRAGKRVTVKLTNIGKMPKNSMGHNFTLLKSGTDVGEFANEALAARDQDYIPPAMEKAVIAHTKLVGPGESDQISFTIKEKGFYDFLCTFPGHYGSMRGKIAAE
ncbi:azurin [Mucilaginibacter sp. PAMB04274]|uniref:azurin n=1 Tax=Mucilaginibacter sp. PAMB04274 TaxID=3138568 RepID=UPI0031F7022A